MGKGFMRVGGGVVDGAKGWGTQGNNDAGEQDPQPQAGNGSLGMGVARGRPTAHCSWSPPQTTTVGEGHGLSLHPNPSSILASLGLEGP